MSPRARAPIGVYNAADAADSERMRGSCVLLALLFVSVGCSAASGPNGFSGAGGGGAATLGTTSTGDTGLGGGFTVSTGGAGGGGAPGGGEVFAHSGTTLYRLDPATKKVTVVGPFASCGFSEVIDIAIDKDGSMFATTFGGLYRVDKQTALCTHIADGGYPNSLSFVPEGTVDPAAEALVGYQGSSYVRIDPKTGSTQTIGAISGGYFSSGDIVSVIGGGTYLTVQGNGCADCIIEVDPKSGDMKKMIGPLGKAEVYGLAFWGGSAYGFSSAGVLFQIDLATAATTFIPMPNPPPGLSFYGAGSTTSAPLMPPE